MYMFEARFPLPGTPEEIGINKSISQTRLDICGVNIIFEGTSGKSWHMR